MDPIKVCLIAFTTLFVGMEVYALSIGSRYKWDFIFIILLLWGVFFLRRKINLHPIPFGLFGVFLFLHFAGMFGWYQSFPLGLEWCSPVKVDSGTS